MKQKSFDDSSFPLYFLLLSIKQYLITKAPSVVGITKSVCIYTPHSATPGTKMVQIYNDHNIKKEFQFQTNVPQDFI